MDRLVHCSHPVPVRSVFISCPTSRRWKISISSPSISAAPTPIRWATLKMAWRAQTIDLVQEVLGNHFSSLCSLSILFYHRNILFNFVVVNYKDKNHHHLTKTFFVIMIFFYDCLDHFLWREVSNMSLHIQHSFTQNSCTK